MGKWFKISQYSLLDSDIQLADDVAAMSHVLRTFSQRLHRPLNSVNTLVIPRLISAITTINWGKCGDLRECLSSHLSSAVALRAFDNQSRVFCINIFVSSEKVELLVCDGKHIRKYLM